MLKRFFSTIVAAFAVVFSASAQAPDPELEFVVELKVKLGQPYGVGETAHGNRFIIPITGGSFEVLTSREKCFLEVLTIR